MRELLRQAAGAGAPAAVALVVPGDCAAPQLVPGGGAPAPQIQQGLKGLALAPLQLQRISATFRPMNLINALKLKMQKNGFQHKL